MEIRHIFSKKMIAVILGAMIINMFFFYVENYDTVEQGRIYDGIVDKYYKVDEFNLEGADPDHFSAVRKAVIMYRQDRPELFGANPDKELSKLINLTQELLEAAVEYRDNYYGNIELKLNGLKRNLNSSLISNDSFERANIQKSLKELEVLLDVEVAVDNGAAFERVMKFGLTQYFVVFLVMAVVYKIMQEKKTGLNMLIESTCKGRRGLLARRVAILAGSGIAIAVLLYGSLMVMGLIMYGGADSLLNPLQSSKDWMYVPFIGSRLAFLVIYVLLAAFFAFSCAMLMWAIMSFISTYQFGISLFVAIMAVEYILYVTVDKLSVVRFLRYINIFLCINVQEVLNNYANWGYSGVVFSVKDTAVVVALVLLLISVAGLVYVSSTRRVVRGVGKFDAWLGRAAGIKNGIIQRLPSLGKEMYKSLYLQKGIVVFVLLVIIASGLHLTKFYDSLQTNITDIFYRTASGYGLGPALDSAYNRSIKSVDMEIENIKRRGYEQEREKQELAPYLAAKDAINAEMERLKMLKAKGIDVVIFNQARYECIRGDALEDNQNMCAFLTLLAGIFLTFGLISYERMCNMNSLIRCVRDRHKVLMRKIIITLIYTLIISATVYLFNWAEIIKCYEPQYLNYPVQSVHSLTDFPLRITTMQYFLMIWGFRTLVLLAVNYMVLFLSSKLSYYGTLAAGLVIIIPQLFALCGIDIMRYVNVGQLLTIR